MRKLLLCQAALVLAIGCALAQPTITRWPDRFEAPSRASAMQKGAERVMVCRPPSRTVAAGQTIVVDVDTADAFRQNTLVTPSPISAGAFALDGDLLTFDAAAGLDTTRAVITVNSCVDEAGEDCRDREVVILVGRAGAREALELDVDGGDVITVAVARRAGELFCGSVNERGDYEYADFREARFSGFVAGDSVRYRSARGSGTDEFLVVLCNAFGTCDTTDLRFRVSGPRVTELPFFDDFAYAGPRPDPALWLEDDVFVNDAYGARAPSFGVATLDGVDGGGRAYGEGLLAVDQLTTAEIDLSDVTGDPVWVKYYLQAGGRAQAPEEIDRVTTQFRHVDGSWVDQSDFVGSRFSMPDTNFVFFALPVRGDTFLHADFQVRFLMRANAAGGFDNFNLDYVSVAQAPDAGADARDIALSARPPSPLTPYTGVPASQFGALGPDLVRTTVPVALWNHFPDVNNVSNTAVVAEDGSGAELLNASLLTGAQFNLPPGYSRFVNEVPSGPAGDYVRAAATLVDAAAETLTLRYELEIDRDQRQLPRILRNDTASTTSVIDAEFAYDDGTAESGLFNGQQGNRTVVRYETAADDTLRGLRFAFPALQPEDTRSQLINLQVYIGPLDLNSGAVADPDFEDPFARPFFPSDVRDSVQAFTTYRIEDSSGEPFALFIPAGEFYVGWQQADASNNPVQVGLDQNNDNTDQVFAAFGGGWVSLAELFPNLEASLMVRPVFGREAPTSSSGTDEAELRALRAYPNPSAGRFRLELAGEVPPGARYRVTDVVGRRIAAGAYRPELELTAAAGVYVVELVERDGRALGRVRVIVR